MSELKPHKAGRNPSVPGATCYLECFLLMHQALLITGGFRFRMVRWPFAVKYERPPVIGR
jgi:hypothetical protein